MSRKSKKWQLLSLMLGAALPQFVCKTKKNKLYVSQYFSETFGP